MSLANLPTTVVVVTHGRKPRMLHLPGCFHNSLAETETRPADDAERATLRDCTSCLLRVERGG
jgi:hypothetical protein